MVSFSGISMKALFGRQSFKNTQGAECEHIEDIGNPQSVEMDTLQLSDQGHSMLRFINKSEKVSPIQLKAAKLMVEHPEKTFGELSLSMLNDISPQQLRDLAHRIIANRVNRQPGKPQPPAGSC